MKAYYYRGMGVIQEVTVLSETELFAFCLFEESELRNEYEKI